MTADTGKTVEDAIFEIEDYVGGNIEGIEHIDRMGFTVFLRNTVNALIAQEQLALIERVRTEVIGDDEQVFNKCDYCGQKECCGGAIPEERNSLKDKQRTALDSLAAEIKEGKDATKE